MNWLYYIFYSYIYKPVILIYLKTDSTTTFDGLKVKVLKGVFHPRFFFSSTYFYEFLKSKSLNHKKFLEIGCGSGLLSMLAYKKKAFVTALDIDPKAVENTKLNFSSNFNTNGNSVNIIKSNVFEQLPIQSYDFIAINPPYYFKKVNADSELAWYCGENGEYFTNLFFNMRQYMTQDTEVYMILAANAEIERIKKMGINYGFEFLLADKKKIKFEESYIFQLK